MPRGVLPYSRTGSGGHLFLPTLPPVPVSPPLLSQIGLQSTLSRLAQESSPLSQHSRLSPRDLGSSEITVTGLRNQDYHHGETAQCQSPAVPSRPRALHEDALHKRRRQSGTQEERTANQKSLGALPLLKDSSLHRLCQ